MSTHREHVLKGGPLELRFAWHNDRFAHRIAIVDRKSGTLWSLLESIEGGPSEPWPASPPFQSLHTEGRPAERQVALLVGMAGKSHWSASVEVDPADACIRFDVACRQHLGAGGAPGSQYHAHGLIDAVDSMHVAVIEPSQERPLALCVDNPAAPARLVVARQTIGIEPELSPPADQATTIRWGYTVRLT